MMRFAKKYPMGIERAAIQCVVVVSLLALLESLAGCASPATQTAATHESALRTELKHEAASINTVRATGTADIKSPNENYSATIDVSLRAPDSLRVKVTGPFGITLGIMLATPKSYIVYNVIENSVMRGDLAPGEPLPFSGFPFRFDDAMLFLRGLPPATPDNQTQMVSSTCSEGHDSSGRFIKCEWDPEGNRKAVIRDSTGQEAYEYFRSFKEINGTRFPSHIAANIRNQGSVTIDFDDVAVNTTALEFSIPVPESARELRSK